MARLSSRFRYLDTIALMAVLLPRPRHCYRTGLGSCAFARRYLRNRCYFLFLRVLRCFSSPRSLTDLRSAWRHRCRRVAPFGNPRVTGHLPLTAAYRSLSRPSSPPGATGIPRAPLSAFVLRFQPRSLALTRLILYVVFYTHSRSPGSLVASQAALVCRLSLRSIYSFLLALTLQLSSQSR